MAEAWLATISQVRSSAKFDSLCSSQAWVRTYRAGSVGRKTCFARTNHAARPRFLGLEDP